MRCAILCVLLNPSQSTWHILCLTHRNKFQFVYVSKWHDRGQISSPISSRNLMPEFESMHLILIYNLKPCSKVLVYLLHCIFFTLILPFILGIIKSQKPQKRIIFTLSWVLIFVNLNLTVFHVQMSNETLHDFSVLAHILWYIWITNITQKHKLVSYGWQLHG